METKRIMLNETSYFGPGARNVIPEEVSKRGFKKALVVTDKELIKHNVTSMVLKVLDDSGNPYVVYDDVDSNPTIINVQKGVSLFKETCADYIIAVGGGSSIDTAKGIGIIARNPEFYDVISLAGLSPTKEKSIPIIAIPTTAGTGSEVTTSYVLTDKSVPKKFPCSDPKCIPVLAIVDAELMISMPKGLTAATGMDALTHAIEGYISTGAWEMTDIYNIKAIQLIAKYIKKAVDNPTDIDARNGMALAQYIAGMGFSNAGLGIVHSMAHQLGAYYNTPHGVANALLLPYVMEYNKVAALSKFKAIANALGVKAVAKMDVDQSAAAAIEAVITLSKSIRIPQKLNEIGVKKEDLMDLSTAAIADPCTLKNPRTISVEDILKIYEAAYN